MRFLRDKDFYRQIQIDNLSQIIEGDYSILSDVEKSAQSEMISYLSKRYDTGRVFANTGVFATTSTYYGNNLVEYSEPLWDTQTIYPNGFRISYNDKIYINATGSITGISPDYSPDWTYITENKSLYYAKLPHNEWDYDTKYSMGDVAWYEDVVYTAILDNTGYFPTDSQRWSAGSTFSFINQMPEDTNYWIKGDNRNQQIVMYLIDITLYHLHSRINPRNVPELRMIRYDGNSPNGIQAGGAIAWLKRVANGEVNADIKEIVPTTGLSIVWGNSGPTNNNFY